MGFERVASRAELAARGMLGVRIRGIDVGLFDIEGAVHAMENRCPHAGVPLTDGTLDGRIVECNAHGWRFDVRTGFRPEAADGFPIPCFAVRVEAGDIYVDLDQCLNLPRRVRRQEPEGDRS